MALHYGVVPTELAAPKDLDHLVGTSERLLLDRKLVSIGDRVAIVAGSSLGAPGTLNGVIIHTVGDL
jgi:pyruvate kinase